MDPFDPNYAFTPEGRQDAIDAAFDVPHDWQNVASPETPNGAQSGAPFAPSAGAQPQEPELPFQPQQPQDVLNHPMVQGAFQENQLLRQVVGAVLQQGQQQQEAAIVARLQELSQNPSQEAVLEAARLVHQHNLLQQQSVQQRYEQQIQQANQQNYAVLVSGFTQEIIANHPNLTDEQIALLETIPNPDHRVLWADHFENQHEQNRQMALQQGATIHAASGAGRTTPVAPGGGAQPQQGNRPMTPLDIIRATPWMNVQG